VGYRPYRAGEDLRQLDWNLLARLDKPYVRVTRQEAGELWVIALDSSASMGVGPPGKWQRAVECAMALGSFAAQSRAEWRFVVSAGPSDAPRVLDTGGPKGFEMGLGFLGGLRASGQSGLSSLFQYPRLFQGAARVFCIGDLLDKPATKLLGLRQRMGELHVLQLLAPHELDPPMGSVEWWDPENGERLKCQVSQGHRDRYMGLLDGRLETWRQLGGRHRFRYLASSSGLSFEELMGAWILR
jgi:uncharacterized protein (DUF58 family)